MYKSGKTYPLEKITSARRKAGGTFFPRAAKSAIIRETENRAGRLQRWNSLLTPRETDSTGTKRQRRRGIPASEICPPSTGICITARRRAGGRCRRHRKHFLRCRRPSLPGRRKTGRPQRKSARRSSGTSAPPRGHSPTERKRRKTKLREKHRCRRRRGQRRSRRERKNQRPRRTPWTSSMASSALAPSSTT